MAKPTKKELKAVLTPLREEAVRYALGLTTGGKVAPRHKPIMWRGLTIDVDVVRRGSVVCGVPFPYAVFHLWYYAYKGDVTPKNRVAGGENGAQLIDNIFIGIARGNLEISHD